MNCNSVEERWTRQRARRAPLREGYRKSSYERNGRVNTPQMASMMIFELIFERPISRS